MNWHTHCYLIQELQCAHIVQHVQSNSLAHSACRIPTSCQADWGGVSKQRFVELESVRGYALLPTGSRPLPLADRRRAQERRGQACPPWHRRSSAVVSDLCQCASAVGIVRASFFRPACDSLSLGRRQSAVSLQEQTKK